MDNLDSSLGGDSATPLRCFELGTMFGELGVVRVTGGGLKGEVGLIVGGVFEDGVTFELGLFVGGVVLSAVGRHV